MHALLLMSLYGLYGVFSFSFFSLSPFVVCVSVSEVDGLWTMNKGSDSFFLFFSFIWMGRTIYKGIIVSIVHVSQ